MRQRSGQTCRAQKCDDSLLIYWRLRDRRHILASEMMLLLVAISAWSSLWDSVTSAIGSSPIHFRQNGTLIFGGVVPDGGCQSFSVVIILRCSLMKTLMACRSRTIRTCHASQTAKKNHPLRQTSSPTKTETSGGGSRELRSCPRLYSAASTRRQQHKSAECGLFAIQEGVEDILRFQDGRGVHGLLAIKRRHHKAEPVAAPVNPDAAIDRAARTDFEGAAFRIYRATCGSLPFASMSSQHESQRAGKRKGTWPAKDRKVANSTLPRDWIVEIQCDISHTCPACHQTPNKPPREGMPRSSSGWEPEAPQSGSPHHE